MPMLVIVRGLPGSGKTTYVRENFSPCEHVEADMFFEHKGYYVFDK